MEWNAPAAALFVVGIFACDRDRGAPRSGASPLTDAPAASDATPGEMGNAARPRADPTPDASLTDAATTDGVVSARYPGDVFTVKATGKVLAFDSTLVREGLGGEGARRVHRFSAAVTLVPGRPFDTIKSERAQSLFPRLFPTGTEEGFVRQDGEGWKVHVGGRDGYRLHAGVEGYDEDVVYLDAAPRGTLRFRCTYVGAVMRPEIPEERQLALCDAILASVTVK